MIKEVLAVAAHPYDRMARSLGRHHLLQNAQGHPPLWQFDAIETMNSSLFPQQANRQATNAASVLRLPITGGSDSHLLETVGYGVTLFTGQYCRPFARCYHATPDYGDGTTMELW
jgi:predicted metal-dependent phosphoesterase TrpH